MLRGGCEGLDAAMERQSLRTSAQRPTGVLPDAESGQSTIKGSGADNLDTQLATLRRLAVAMERLSASMTIVLVLLLFMTIGIIAAVAITASRMSSAIEEISESVSPVTISAMSDNVLSGTNMGRMSMQNVLDATESAKTIMARTLDTLNTTTDIIENANTLMAEVVQHPRLSLEVGGR